jgi:hypothetical protein
MSFRKPKFKPQISLIQPSSVPQNVHFYIDDASEEDWAVPSDYFDYIYTRVLLGCFADFQEVIKKGFYYTKPGGHTESQEIMSTPCCDDGTMPEDWPFLEWTRYSDDAAVAADQPLRIADKIKRWYQEAGFVDVEEKVFKLPMNSWPRDKHLKALGRMSEDNWLAGIAGFSIAPFSRILSWSKAEIEVSLGFICLADECPRCIWSICVRPSQIATSTHITKSLWFGAGNLWMTKCI